MIVWCLFNDANGSWNKYSKEQKGNNIKVHLKSDIEHNNKVMHAKRKRDYYKQWKTTLNGISTTLGLLKVIEHFKPLIWVIENPETSKIWEFIRENVDLKGWRNKTYYNAYDMNFTKKPTIFFSNVKLDLRLNNIRQLRKWEETQGYTLRSSIPKDLLKDIIEQITKKGGENNERISKS